MIRYIILLLICVYACTNSKHIANEMYELAIAEFVEFDKLFYDSLKSNKQPELEEVKKMTRLKEEIESPFKKSRFYLYTYDAYDPALRVIIIKNINTEVLNNYFEAERDKLFSDKFVQKINSLISREATFSNNQLIALSDFMLTSYHGENSIIRLTTWNDIPTNSENPIPDYLKDMIIPFTIEESSNEFKYHGYVWESATTFIYKVNFIYNNHNNKIIVEAENIGSYGSGLTRF